MFGELLREYGIGVSVLGASTPAEVVAEFLARSGADTLAVSCSVPIFFPGAVRLIDAAHRQGIPVIAGGPAFGHGPSRAERLGADAWALTAADAAAILLGWKSEPPSVSRESTLVDPVALRLTAQADALGGAALAGLAARFPPMADTTNAGWPARGRIWCSSSNSWRRPCSPPTRRSSATSSAGWKPSSSSAACREALITGLGPSAHGQAADAGAALLLDLGRRNSSIGSPTQTAAQAVIPNLQLHSQPLRDVDLEEHRTPRSSTCDSTVAPEGCGRRPHPAETVHTFAASPRGR